MSALIKQIRKIAANLKKSISLKLCSLVGQLVPRVAMQLVSSNICDTVLRVKDCCAPFVGLFYNDILIIT